jgi:hypothetical protein
MAIGPPLVNGNYFDFSSITIALNNGTKITGFKSIGYTSEQQPGEVWGSARQLLGRTPGQHKASGSFELYRPEWLDLQTALQGPQAINNLSILPGAAPGLFEVNFPIIVSFSESAPLGVGSPLTMPTQTDVIIGARITKVDQSHSQGSDALTVKCDFSAMYIAYNNAIPINVLLQAGGLS